MYSLRTDSVEGTRSVAAAIAELACPGDVVLLAGELGAGKTAFAQGFDLRGAAHPGPRRRVPPRPSAGGRRPGSARAARRGRRGAGRVGRRRRRRSGPRLPRGVPGAGSGRR
ncbi:MAG: tRNA (adenosine(37)-N6)-threonylcarbamoyltransferase complex ATPase subunit type 1 TsaE [Actinobacteria bacterium]|nr:MAG: tRNA (adenosine(37)-N6)-threonylcarbamoyltransferase complex ATPase subunit type 1 TsaE [Actinomycetota bacterium]